MNLKPVSLEWARNWKQTKYVCLWERPPKRHTSYLSFLLHWQDFRKPNFTPKKTTKGTKNTKNVSEKVKYMHFFHSIWKNLHLTENFYTDMSVVSVTNKRYANKNYAGQSAAQFLSIHLSSSAVIRCNAI